MRTEFIKVAVIGSGTMGTGIAIVLAKAGILVNLVDIEERILEKSQEKIKDYLKGSVARGKITEDEYEGVYNKIFLTIDLREATKDIQLVIETIDENETAKKQLYEELEVLCSEEVIFATNTSSISISKLASVTKRADKFLGMHFFNPPQVMNLIEIIGGNLTEDKVIEDITYLCRKLGKTPVFSRETPGFIVNRLLWSFLNESYRLLELDVATKENIDTAVKLGLNHPMGPLELSDYIGLDVLLDFGNYIAEQLGEEYSPSSLLRELVEEGNLGKKTGKGFYNYKNQ